MKHADELQLAEFDRLAAEIELAARGTNIIATISAGSLTLQQGWGMAGPGASGFHSVRVQGGWDYARGCCWAASEATESGSSESSEVSKSETDLGSFAAAAPMLAAVRARFDLKDMSRHASAIAACRRAAEALEPLAKVRGMTVPRGAGRVGLEHGWGVAGPDIGAWSVDRMVAALDTESGRWVVTEEHDQGTTAGDSTNTKTDIGAFETLDAAVERMRQRFGLLGGGATEEEGK